MLKTFIPYDYSSRNSLLEDSVERPHSRTIPVMLIPGTADRLAYKSRNQDQDKILHQSAEALGFMGDMYISVWCSAVMAFKIQ